MFINGVPCSLCSFSRAGPSSLELWDFRRVPPHPRPSLRWHDPMGRKGHFSCLTPHEGLGPSGMRRSGQLEDPPCAWPSWWAALMAHICPPGPQPEAVRTSPAVLLPLQGSSNLPSSSPLHLNSSLTRRPMAASHLSHSCHIPTWEPRDLCVAPRTPPGPRGAHPQLCRWPFLHILLPRMGNGFPTPTSRLRENP